MPGKGGQENDAYGKEKSHAAGEDRSSRDESQKPVETSVRHRAGHGQMLGSQKQESMVARSAETPATSLSLLQQTKISEALRISCAVQRRHQAACVDTFSLDGGTYPGVK